MEAELKIAVKTTSKLLSDVHFRSQASSLQATAIRLRNIARMLDYYNEHDELTAEGLDDLMAKVEQGIKQLESTKGMLEGANETLGAIKSAL